jgi:hypothetical protein
MYTVSKLVQLPKELFSRLYVYAGVRCVTETSKWLGTYAEHQPGHEPSHSRPGPTFRFLLVRGTSPVLRPPALGAV